MDRRLLEWLILAGVAVPYVVEVVGQVPLLTRVMKGVPENLRQRLPPHPRWVLFGSTRFFLALFRYALRDDAEDGAEMRSLKRAIRRSAVRELIFGLLLAAAVILLWRRGWRPWH